jgi:hypothetical protein
MLIRERIGQVVHRIAGLAIAASRNRLDGADVESRWRFRLDGISGRA